MPKTSSNIKGAMRELRVRIRIWIPVMTGDFKGKEAIFAPGVSTNVMNHLESLSFRNRIADDPDVRHPAEQLPRDNVARSISRRVGSDLQGLTFSPEKHQDDETHRSTFNQKPGRPRWKIARPHSDQRA